MQEMNKDEYIKQLNEQNQIMVVALKSALDAIVWMSGSSSFAPGGEAHEGWIKTKPILDGLQNIINKAESN